MEPHFSVSDNKLRNKESDGEKSGNLRGHSMESPL